MKSNAKKKGKQKDTSTSLEKRYVNRLQSGLQVGDLEKRGTYEKESVQGQDIKISRYAG